MNDTFHTKQFNCIQSLRGFTALLVVLEHVRFLNCGAFGVDIFFCISGFMAMYATHKSTKHFLRKRLIRIYPLYALVTMANFVALLLFPTLFHLTKATPSSLIKSLLFIPFEISEGIIQPIVRVGWTINYEMLFYLLFALSFRISHKYRGLICSVLLGSLVALTHILPVKSTILTFYGDYIQLEFILGILLYYIVRELSAITNGQLWSRWASYISVLLVAAIFILLALTKKQTPIADFGRVLYWGIPAFFIVLLTFVMEWYVKPHKSLIFLGNLSFSIYLLHYYPIMLIDRKFYSLETYTPMAILVTLATLSLIIAVSYISYIIIEKNFSSFLRNLFEKL